MQTGFSQVRATEQLNAISYVIIKNIVFSPSFVVVVFFFKKKYLVGHTASCPIYVIILILSDSDGSESCS